jgi:molybdopterin molybdotransferase
MPPPLSVDEALARILDGVAPTPAESVAIEAAHRRTLAEPLAALITQPPFNASAMDGYAVRAADVAGLPATLELIGEAAAGHPFAGSIAGGQAVRIFTGAPLPAGADAVVIQENTQRDGAKVIVREGTPDHGHVRHTGIDFRAGDMLLATGRRLGPREVALAAAMGHGVVPVRRRPRVAVISTGDELVPPGSRPGPGQIISSNHLGVAALAEATGAQAELIGIARDTRESLEEHFARAEGADVIVTIGGASVGDHDLVGPVLKARGMALSFWKIAMRPGQPLMFGRLGPARVMGLPGNPVSSLVCTRVFLVPLLRALLGQPARDERPIQATAGVALEGNGLRQHYMRATTAPGPDGLPVVTPVHSQDSSLLAPLAQADCLLVRPPRAPAVPRGTLVPILPLDF